MAFPVVEATATSKETSGTDTHTVDLPAGIVSGNLLFMEFAHGNFRDPTSAPTGWTETSPPGQAVASNARVRYYFREADGNEGSTVTVTTNGNCQSCHYVRRISGAVTTEPESATENNGTSTAPDPPSVTAAGGAADILWIASCVTSIDNLTVQSAPTNYSNLTTLDTDATGGEVLLASAERNLNAASEDPGTFTLSTSSDWVACTFAIAPAATGPTAPSGLTATLSAVDEIDLAWTDNSSTETGFEIERDSGSGFTLIHTTAADATSYTDTGLAASTTYTYRVRATDGSNTSSYTSEASATTAPAAPTAVTASNPTDDTIDVDWTDNTGGAHQHRVYSRVNSSGDPWLLEATLPAGTTSDTVTGLEDGTLYDIGVASYDSANDVESAIVSDTEATTSSGGPTLTAPSNLQVTGFTATSVSLSWTDNTGGYENRVYYRTPPSSGTYVLFSTLSSENESDTVTGLSPGTQYEFEVRAWDGSSESTGNPSVTETTSMARWVTGVHMLGTEGRTVIEAEGGAIPSGTGADDGATTKTLPKGVGSGTIDHLGTVNYAEPYQNAPTIIYAGGGLSVQGASQWGTKSDVDAGTASAAPPTTYGPKPVFEGDVSGFTAHLYLQGSAALTTQTQSLSSPTTLTTPGTTGEATPGSSILPAVDDTYSVDFSGSMESGINGSGDVSVALEARLNGGTWMQIGSVAKTFSFKGTNTTWNFSGTISGTIADMDGSGTDQFRCRLVSAESPVGTGADANVSVTFGPDVEWQTGSPSFASMTPEDGDEVSFVVLGNTGSA